MLTPDIYDPALNPLYRDVLAHYGAVALPCRVGDPDRKGKVESGIGHTQRTPLQGLRFETIEAAQAYLDRWDEHWADTRIHGTTKRQVAAMFAEERPALRPLPVEPFRYYRFRRPHGASRWLRRSRGRLLRRAAGLDRPARPRAVERPARAADRSEDAAAPARASARAARLASDRRSAISRPGRRRPRSRCSAARRPPARRSARSADHIHAQGAAHSVRQILGVLALAKKHGVAVVEDAAKAALDIGVPTYRFLRKYVERRPPVPLTLAPSRSAHPTTHALSRPHRSENRRL